MTEMSGWMPIAGWEGLYEAHPRGKVRSLDRLVQVSTWHQRSAGRVLSATYRGRYLAVSLTDGERRETAYLHALIARTFIGPRPEALVVCHNDGDRTNNAVENLRYDTRSNNNRDAVAHGTNPLSARSACKAGHEYTPENTGFQPSRRGRMCLTCSRSYKAASSRRTRARKKELA